MALYTEKVMDHFRNPRNLGKMDDADGIGEVGNAKCGDIMKIYIKVKDNIITDVKFNTLGCGSANPSTKRWSFPTKPLWKPWTVCPPIKFTVPFWRKKQLKPPLKIITTKTALLTTPKNSANAIMTAKAAVCKILL